MEYVMKYSLTDARKVSPESDEVIATITHDEFKIALQAMKLPRKSKPRYLLNYLYKETRIMESETNLLFDVVSLKSLEDRMALLMTTFMADYANPAKFKP